MNRRLFRSESLNPNRFKWRDLLQLLNPRSWDGLYILLPPLVGFFVTIYIAILWVIHFASTGAWALLFLTAAALFSVIVAAQLGFNWADSFLAAIIGLVTATFFSGYMGILLP
jgi:riboflavin transporter FmnP